MARPTRGTVATLSANGGNTSAHLLSVTVPSGSGRGLLIYIAFRRSTTESITAISRDGQTPSLFATEGTHNGTGWATRVYYITDANAGTADLSVTLSANRNTRIIAIPYTGVDTGGTPWGTPTRESDLSTQYGASVTADQELIAFAGGYDAAAAAGTFTPTGTGQTELDDNRINDIYAAASYQHETGTVTASWTFGAATLDESSNWLVTVNGAVSGPTIDTQPTAQTSRLNGEGAGAGVSFVVAATTSGGALSYQWQEEDSVGAGTYTNISNGGIYAGATSTTLVITPTTEDESGLRYRCNVTDSNGTTTTNAVALTVLTGPVLTVYTGATNVSGVLTTTLTSDDALTTNGEVLCIEATMGSTVVRTTVRPA